VTKNPVYTHFLDMSVVKFGWFLVAMGILAVREILAVKVILAVREIRVVMKAEREEPLSSQWNRDIGGSLATA
jgi:hypothetical protein